MNYAYYGIGRSGVASHGPPRNTPTTSLSWCDVCTLGGKYFRMLSWSLADIYIKVAPASNGFRFCKCFITGLTDVF